VSNKIDIFLLQAKCDMLPGHYFEWNSWKRWTDIPTIYGRISL